MKHNPGHHVRGNRGIDDIGDPFAPDPEKEMLDELIEEEQAIPEDDELNHRDYHALTSSGYLGEGG